MLGLSRVRENAKEDKTQTFTSLMHHLTPALLNKSFTSSNATQGTVLMA
ncbi:MAG: hypothetical protein ACI9W2_000098 [Gammaproteobacteria bacterium]|jgi:hypothetical protein